MIEFIDMAHTPKNILIKAILKPNHSFDQVAYKNYQDATQMLNLDLSLAKMLGNSLSNEV